MTRPDHILRFKFGIVSYNIYCNFTNYGSALQSWALCRAVDKIKIKNKEFRAVLIDYCPDVLKNKNPLSPFENMWDTDEKTRELCRMSLPAIYENFYKFDNFYKSKFNKTAQKYTSENFCNVIKNENLNGFICGSDTIFCIDEFEGFDDGYYANYECMKNNYTFAYAASFGDSHFNESSLEMLKERLKNFKAVGLRESFMIDYVRSNVKICVEQVIDPTLLLNSNEYENLTADYVSKNIPKKYILLYSRRYNPEMENYADILAKNKNLKVIEISLRASNSDRHIMFYEAGIEEFLHLVKNAEYIITNSYHGMIFSIQFQKNFTVFSREQGDSKIFELLKLLDLNARFCRDSNKIINDEINYYDVNKKLNYLRARSLKFLTEALNEL